MWPTGGKGGGGYYTQNLLVRCYTTILVIGTCFCLAGLVFELGPQKTSTEECLETAGLFTVGLLTVNQLTDHGVMTGPKFIGLVNQCLRQYLLC